MAAGEMNEDDSRPAPLPAHERGWRHPSEVGHEAWELSEPPIMIGRGLTATTGGIAIMIALAVLWTMVPTQAGRTAVVSVRSTLAASEPLANPSSSPLPTEPPESSSAAAGTFAPSTVVASTGAPTTTAAPPPMATYDVPQTNTLARGAVAIAISGSSLAITTALAVSADNAVELMLTDGSTEMAKVLYVDQVSGLAVLATDSLREQLAFTLAEIAPGDELSLAGDSDHKVRVGVDGALDQDLMYDESVREGTPVMNQDGDLVGLCSKSNGENFVVLGDLDVLHRALAGWAGLKVGDIIVAIDGMIVADAATLITALAGLMPGDELELTVRSARSDEETTLIVKFGVAAADDGR